MLKLLFILIAFNQAFVHSQVRDDAKNINPEGCGRRPFANANLNKIVGGHPAARGDWGWQVGMNWYNQQNTHFCGGVLINSEWVLTAGHCFDGMSSLPHYFSMNFGFYDRKNPNPNSATSQVAKILMHEDYDNLLNDICLIKLKTPVKYSDYIVPACIPEGDTVDKYAGQESWSTGWGSIVDSMNPVLSRDLLEVNLPVLTDEACLVKYPFLHMEKNFCVGETGAGKDTCGGDSGGPLVVRDDNGEKRGPWTVAGLTSFGYGCGDGGVVLRISNYIDWIKAKLANE